MNVYWLLFQLCPAHAGDVYMLEGADGMISFTDAPEHNGFILFDVDGDPPEPSQINLTNFPLLDSYDALFLEAERKTGVNAELLKAVGVAESGLNPNAVSRAGAQGLMQIIPPTAESLGVVDAFDPEQAIDGGARYLAAQLAKFGDVQRALAAYNAGPHNVERYNGIPPFEETQVYVKRVTDIHHYFRTKRPLNREPRTP